MAELDDHIATYLAAIAIEGKTRATQASYANSLADFRAIGRRLGLPGRAPDYTVPHVYAFLSALRARGASAGYQHRRHREVKTCFSWLKRMGFVEENVFARVPLVKRPLLLKPPFSPAEVQALLNSQDRASHSGARNYALILFLLDSGVRASECVALTLAEVDWERSRAFIRHGKGEKQRWVGFGPTTAIALRDYVASYRGDSPGALFLTATLYQWPRSIRYEDDLQTFVFAGWIGLGEVVVVLPDGESLHGRSRPSAAIRRGSRWPTGCTPARDSCGAWP